MDWVWCLYDQTYLIIDGGCVKLVHSGGGVNVAGCFSPIMLIVRQNSFLVYGVSIIRSDVFNGL